MISNWTIESRLITSLYWIICFRIVVRSCPISSTLNFKNSRDISWLYRQRFTSYCGDMNIFLSRAPSMIGWCKRRSRRAVCCRWNLNSTAVISKSVNPGKVNNNKTSISVQMDLSFSQMMSWGLWWVRNLSTYILEMETVFSKIWRCWWKRSLLKSIKDSRSSCRKSNTHSEVTKIKLICSIKPNSSRSSLWTKFCVNWSRASSAQQKWKRQTSP